MSPVPPPVRLGGPTKRGAPHPRCWKRPRFGFRVEKGFRASWGGPRGNWGSLGGFLGELEGTGGSLGDLWGGSAPTPQRGRPILDPPSPRGHTGGVSQLLLSTRSPPTLRMAAPKHDGTPQEGKTFYFSTPPEEGRTQSRIPSAEAVPCRAAATRLVLRAGPALVASTPQKHSPQNQQQPPIKAWAKPSSSQKLFKRRGGWRRLPPEPEAALWGGCARVGRGKSCPKSCPYRASVSLMSRRMVVVTEVPKESVIW